jgi:hypothetical protein
MEGLKQFKTLQTVPPTPVATPTTRNREKDLARLNQLKSARKEREAIMERFAAKAQAATAPQPRAEPAIGSVFSTSETPAPSPLAATA